MAYSEDILKIQNLNKIYATGLKALENINLNIKKGEIFALLGPNGAGKTTLINIICGIVNLSSGEVSVNGFDIQNNYREARSQIGLVPQELTNELFEKVWSTIKFSRGLFGKTSNDALLTKILKELSLFEKRDQKIMTLSGGMKRRVMIAKALSHEPKILFLDEPTAGVDVELRRDMWNLVRRLREEGVTVILTTHYIEEAEEMADRIGVINKGQLVLVEDKNTLMKKLGKKQLQLHLLNPLAEIPTTLKDYSLELNEDKSILTYQYDTQTSENKIPDLLKILLEHQIEFKDLKTLESSLEEIFVSLVKK